MKRIILAAAVLAAEPAIADEVTNIKVYDHNKTIVREVPVNEYRCKDVRKPVYGTVQKQGNAAEGALLGMIIGGIAGKGLSGNDDGAAAGAVIGGLIGADNGAKPKTRQEVIGYEIVEKCNEVTTYQTEYVDVYSHSTIRFYLNGKRYVLEFDKR
jgi:uncharacterized protein YcfJ